MAETLGESWLSLDRSDPSVIQALEQLRQGVVQAKELLCVELEVPISVVLPGLVTSVRVTRRELERRIRPLVDRALESYQEALDIAEVAAGELRSTLLVGGSSRIPLVGELISGQLGVAVALDAHPKFVVCLGAAIAAGRRLPGDTVSGPVVAVERQEPVGDLVESAGSDDAVTILVDLDAQGLTSTLDVPLEPVIPHPRTKSDDDVPAVRPSHRRGVVIGATVGLAALVTIGIAALATDGSGGTSTSSTASATTIGPRIGPLSLELGSAPTGLAIGFGSAWATTQDGQLVEVNALNGRIGTKIALDSSLDDVVVGDAEVWATGTHAVHIVDPVSRSKAKTIEMPGKPEGIAAARGAIWVTVAEPTKGLLYRVDEPTALRKRLHPFRWASARSRRTKSPCG